MVRRTVGAAGGPVEARYRCLCVPGNVNGVLRGAQCDSPIYSYYGRLRSKIVDADCSGPGRVGLSFPSDNWVRIINLSSPLAALARGSDVARVVLGSLAGDEPVVSKCLLVVHLRLKLIRLKTADLGGSCIPR